MPSAPLVVSRRMSQPVRPSRAPKRVPRASRSFQAQDVHWVRFARQPIVCGDVDPMGWELGFCWSNDPSRAPPQAGPSVTHLTLSHALLDGSVTHKLAGRMFVPMDRETLLSPVADVLCASLGVIQLPGSLAVDDALTRRLVQLHARGYVFALADLRTHDDPRWCWAGLSAFAKLDMSRAPSAGWAGLLERARACGQRVVADRVQFPTDYLRLRRLGVELFQGELIGPPIQDHARGLPTCDVRVLIKLIRLLEGGAERAALAITAATDPALVIRLLLLQRLYGPAPKVESPMLVDVLASLPYSVVDGWFRILRSSSFETPERGRNWSASVREQMYNYRARLIGARLCKTPEELETRVFDLYRRICSRDGLIALPHLPDDEDAS